MPRGKISEEERKRRKNVARNLLYATDSNYAKRGKEKAARYRLEHPDKAKACKDNHYRKNKATVNAKKNARYANNPEPAKAYSIAYSREHKAEILLYNKEYRAAKATNIKAQKAASYLKNREVILQRCAAYSAKNSVRIRSRVKAWAAANPDKVRISHINRRAMKKNAGGKLSSDIVAKLMVLQQGKCPCCRVDLRNVGYHLDHIEALSKGGAHDDKNMQLLCPPCNLSKHAKPPIEFMQSLGFLL